MKEIAIYALEVFLCSGVLSVAYLLLFERKVPYFICRLYLIGSALLAAVIPLLRIPLWPSQAQMIEVQPITAMVIPGNQLSIWNGS